MKKSDISESAKNIETLHSICNITCSRDECEELRKHYMNQHAEYMAARIISVLLIEFMMMVTIIRSGIDELWKDIPYADSLIYISMWSIGGIYLLQMMIRIVWNTYKLKIALDQKQIHKTDAKITLHRIEVGENRKLLDKEEKKKLRVYARIGKKNVSLWFYVAKRIHKRLTFTNNLIEDDRSGTELVIYFVDDKKNDIFIMVKNRRTGEMIDKAMKRTLLENYGMWKIKMNMIKNKFKKGK